MHELFDAFYVVPVLTNSPCALHVCLQGAAGFKSDGAQGVGEAREAHVEIHLVDPDGEPTLGPLSAALRGKTPQRAQRSPWSPGVRR